MGSCPRAFFTASTSVTPAGSPSSIPSLEGRRLRSKKESRQDGTITGAERLIRQGRATEASAVRFQTTLFVSERFSRSLRRKPRFIDLS
jgi:hypothetical protein